MNFYQSVVIFFSNFEKQSPKKQISQFSITKYTKRI